MSHHLTTCTFCGVGCGINLETTGNEITGTYPSMSHPANHGRICVRGWHVHEVASSPDRLRKPLIRKNGTLQESTWDEAYGLIASKFKEIREKNGPDAIGFLNSARCSNEDGYILQKFARAIIGTNNVDQGTSLYRTNSIEVLRETIGMPAATNSIEEIMQSKAILLNEIDLGQQLPTIGGLVIRAKLAGAKLICVGARKHRVAEHADILLQTKPGTEAFLYGAMAKIIVDRGLMDLAFIRERCKGYERFLKHIQSFDLHHAAKRCDVSLELIEKAAIVYGSAKPAMFLYSTGAEARGRELIQSMVNLVMLTGNLGKEGSGLMPLTEHNNVQGGSDVGMMPGYLPGYRPVSNSTMRNEFENAWDCDLPVSAGLDTTQMLGTKSKLKAIWLDRHNPVVSATYADARVALEAMDFVVLQNLFMTRTAEMADVILPTAAFGEENVTFTNTERRVQIAAKVIEPPEGLCSAWQQVVDVANRMGAKWEYASSSEVMKEITSVVPDMAQITYKNLQRGYGRQWPCGVDSPLGTKFVFGPGFKYDWDFRFASVAQPDPDDEIPADYPFILAFGHSLYYWHQNTLVQHSETLKREYGILLLDYPDGFVEISPEDAKALQVRDGQKIKLVAAAGSAVAAVRVTAELRPGIVYVPYFLTEVTHQLMGSLPPEDKTGTHSFFVRIEKGA